MKERRELAGQRVLSGNARSFVAITVNARDREVVCGTSAVVLASNYVVNLEGHAGASLRQVTVFTPSVSTLPHQSL
jgi:hypothetical protein